MIRCPHCNSLRTRVIGGAGSKQVQHNHYRRHRKCKACSRNFFTREYIEDDAMHDADATRIATSLIAKALTYLEGRKLRTKPRKRKSVGD